jgi:calcineurin-like phosphoesterase family protein
MGEVKYISDPHLGHERMAIKRGFSSAEDYNEFFIDSWNSSVRKRDTVWIIGDLTMEKSSYEILDRLNGIKKVVLGNHDKSQHLRKLLNHVNQISGYSKTSYRDKEIAISHIPVVQKELAYRFDYNLHGHTHEHLVTKTPDKYSILDHTPELIDPRYINVCPEIIGYKPLTLESIFELYEESYWKGLNPY